MQCHIFGHRTVVQVSFGVEKVVQRGKLSSGQATLDGTTKSRSLGRSTRSACTQERCPVLIDDKEVLCRSPMVLRRRQQ